MEKFSLDLCYVEGLFPTLRSSPYYVVPKK
jgi:hypothetical protein